MLDELFDDVPMVGVLITWGVGIAMLVWLSSQWVGTSLEMGIFQMIIFGVILLVPAYVITKFWANKD